MRSWWCKSFDFSSRKFLQKPFFFHKFVCWFCWKFNLTDEFSVNNVIPYRFLENNIHKFISGQKGDNKVTCSATNLFFPLTASKSMKANKWHAYTEKIIVFLIKQSLLCASSGFSFRFVLHESIGLSFYGFWMSQCILWELHKTCFCLYCFKKPILESSQGRQLKIIEIIFCLRKSWNSFNILTQKQATS